MAICPVCQKEFKHRTAHIKRMHPEYIDNKERSESSICETCKGRGYIELDKIGLLIKPCYDCGKGKEFREMIGMPATVEEEKPDGDNNK